MTLQMQQAITKPNPALDAKLTIDSVIQAGEHP